MKVLLDAEQPSAVQGSRFNSVKPPPGYRGAGVGWSFFGRGAYTAGRRWRRSDPGRATGP